MFIMTGFQEEQRQVPGCGSRGANASRLANQKILYCIPVEHLQ